MTSNELQRNELQRSERLAPYVASYRDAEPLIALTEVEQIVAQRATLHDPSTHINWRKKIMFTITGASLLTLAYLTLFRSGVDNPPTVTPPELISQGQVVRSQPPTPTIKEEATSVQPSANKHASSNSSTTEDSETQADSLFSYYTLTDAEQKRIGLLDEGFAVTYFYTGSNNDIRCMGILRTWGALTKNRSMPSDVSALNALPKFVTDGSGRKRVMSYESKVDSAESERRFREINSLIPILVRENASSTSMSERDLLFWYLPTDEFISLLPEQVRSQVNENTTNIKSGVKQNQDAIFNASIYPNPSKGELYLKFEHEVSGKAKVVLRNLQGVAMATERMVDVDSRQDIRLNYDVPDGVYLLDILPQHGERLVLRVIIVK